MNFFKQLFRRTLHRPAQQRQEVTPLAIEGIPEAPFTAEPDDAELAAQAVLEIMSGRSTPITQNTPNTQNTQSAQSAPIIPTADHYRALADRIREAHRKSALQVARFLYNCELELQKPHLPYYGAGSVQLLEAELYKRLDIVEREGGELKRRWQHCLAEVTVRLMNAPPPAEEEVTQKKGK